MRVKGDFPFLHARSIAHLSKREVERYKRDAFTYWRCHGFPFPSLSDSEIRNYYQRFCHSTRTVFGPHRTLTWSPLGIGLANYFQPHMWSTKCEYFRSPVDVFDNDDFLRQCIDRSIRINKDRRPLNPNNMRVMLSTFRNTKRVANFRPTVARDLYTRYSPERGVILDPAAGYGGRLLGVFPLKRTYIGIEPQPRTVRGLRHMAQRVRELKGIRANIEIVRGRAEAEMRHIESRSVDLVIASPPYFGRERYGGDRDQSSVRYPTYEDWKQHFLVPVIGESARVLRRGGFLCMNVQNTETAPVSDDAVAIAREYLRPYFAYQLLIGSVPYHRNGRRGGHRSESLYVLQKR